MTRMLTRRLVLAGASAQLTVACNGPELGDSRDLSLCQDLSRAVFFESYDKVSSVKQIIGRRGIALSVDQERDELERVLQKIRAVFDLGQFSFDVTGAGKVGARNAWDIRFTCRAGRSSTRAVLRMEL